ncbi:hypothetical protein [Floccifex sp.]|uniref:hypothetical protein n=1 Tax=Floccifex sp. TaxID=2815810 RepID=UPI002A759858|nr:hypothetical protein [Floccifex sp.]MDD7282077.1 hypothetical protein [Erysipelotrichaceae bacterium]MDY2958987.1 hypothetical protein [Floccifex sp.]
MKSMGDICIDFRDNSIEEINTIKDYFRENKYNDMWVKEGKLTDNIFMTTHDLSFTSVCVPEGTFESVKTFLNGLVNQIPSIKFKGLVLEEKDNLTRELRIKKTEKDDKVDYDFLEREAVNRSDIDSLVIDLHKLGKDDQEIANELEINVHFVEDVLE